MRDDTDNDYLFSEKVYFINPNNVGALDTPMRQARSPPSPAAVGLN
ncbi:hypothetical protein [Mesorhizobium loti]|nr:hypothetical protein [Mesorhizobium loti]